jgi:hypothetical protein
MEGMDKSAGDASKSGRGSLRMQSKKVAVMLPSKVANSSRLSCN